MIKALLATAMVAKRMTVSILLLILLLSSYPTFSGRTTIDNDETPYQFMEEVIFSANFENNLEDNNWTLTSSAVDGNWINDIPSPYGRVLHRWRLMLSRAINLCLRDQ